MGDAREPAAHTYCPSFPSESARREAEESRQLLRRGLPTAIDARKAALTRLRAQLAEPP